jgi:hypothetical protein
MRQGLLMRGACQWAFACLQIERSMKGVQATGVGTVSNKSQAARSAERSSQEPN